jgi:hypothetical protein
LGRLLIAASVRAVRARWFRWLGWIPVIALLLAGTGGMLGGIGLGAALALGRCQGPGCQASDKPPGPDPAVTKSEPEWLVATSGAALMVGSMGSLFSALFLGGAWILSLGVGTAELLHARRGRATTAAGPVSADEG